MLEILKEFIVACIVDGVVDIVGIVCKNLIKKTIERISKIKHKEEKEVHMAEKSIKEKAGNLLISFGMDPSWKGFWYITEAVELFNDGKMVTDCCREIAKRNNCQYSAVERAMQNAFNKLDWDKDCVKEFFGNVKRSNSTLIGMLVWKLTLKDYQ